VGRLDAEVPERLFDRLESSQAFAVDDDELARTDADVDRWTGEVERLAMITPSHPKAVAAHQGALEAAESALTRAEDHRDALRDAQAQNGPDVRELRADFTNYPIDEQREILRPGIDTVLVRRASSRGPSSQVADRILVLFHGEAPAELVNGRGPIRGWIWSDGPSSLRMAA
jgi:multidrug resistance efflux pump